MLILILETLFISLFLGCSTPQNPSERTDVEHCRNTFAPHRFTEEQIAEGENLNIIELKDKYLQATKTKKEKKEPTKGSINSESLLEKITYKSKTYY